MEGSSSIKLITRRVEQGWRWKQQTLHHTTWGEFTIGLSARILKTLLYSHSPVCRVEILHPAASLSLTHPRMSCKDSTQKAMISFHSLYHMTGIHRLGFVGSLLDIYIQYIHVQYVSVHTCTLSVHGNSIQH